MRRSRPPLREAMTLATMTLAAISRGLAALVVGISIAISSACFGGGDLPARTTASHASAAPTDPQTEAQDGTPPAPVPPDDPGSDEAGAASAGGAEIRRFLESRRREAKKAYEEGNFRGAWQIAEAILVLAPDVPYREELRRLRRDAQGRYLAQSVVIVTFVPSGEPAFPIAELRGDVVIENHSSEAITVGSREKEPVLGLAQFRVRSIGDDAFGGSAEAGTRVVRMPDEFRVEPGAVHRLPVAIPVPLPPEGTILQQWEVTGVLRPITVRVGKEFLTRGVPWIAAGGAALEADLADIAAEPRGQLRRALLTGDRRRFIAASALWWAEAEAEGGARIPEKHDALVGEILANLGRFDGELDHPAIRLLEEITGEVRERTTESWQIWGLTRARESPRAEEP